MIRHTFPLPDFPTIYIWYACRKHNLYVLIAKPNLRDLVRLEVAPEWYSLGLQLGLTENTLNIIEKDISHDVSTCMRKMFSKWLSSSKDASYADLVDALVAIDKKDVAENVSQKFCKLRFLFAYMHVPCNNVLNVRMYVATKLYYLVYVYVHTYIYKYLRMYV